MNLALTNFRDKLIVSFPWVMLCLIMLVSVAIQDQKLTTNIYRVLVCLPIFLLIKKDDFKLFISDNFNRIFLILLIYCAFTLTWEINSTTDNFLGRLLTTFLFFYLLFLISVHNHKKFIQIDKLYIVASFVFLMLIPFYKETGVFLSLGTIGHSAFSLRSGTGWFLASIAVLCFYNGVFHTHNKYRYIYHVYFIILLSLIIINQSRGGILIAINGVIGVLILGLKKDHIKKIAITAFLGLVTFTMLFIAFKPFFMRLIERGDSGRFVVYQNAWSSINESWLYFLFGHGAAASSENYINTTKISNYHNLYLDTWFNYGLIGLLLLISCISYRVLPVFSKKIQHNVWDAVLFGILAGTLTEGGFFYTHPGSMLWCFLTPLLLSNLHQNYINRKQSAL